MSRYDVYVPRLDKGINERLQPGSSGEDAYNQTGIHHPKTNAGAVRSGNASQVDSEAAHVDGHLEAVRTRGDQNGIPLVKKDLILKDDKGNTNIMVPAPVEGYVQNLRDGTNAISIWKQPIGTPGNELVGQVLHGARGSNTIADGAFVQYGQPLVRQSDVGAKGAVHAHIELEPAQFKKYLGDMLNGRLTQETRPTQEQSTSSPSASVAPKSADPMADGVLRQGEKGEAVRNLQEALNKNGANLNADGNFGPNTKTQLQAYQRSHNLDPDGVAGAKTLASLGLTAQKQESQASTPTPAANPTSAGVATTQGTASHGVKFTPEVRAYLDLVAWKETAGGLNRSSYYENNGVRGSTGHFTDADVQRGNGFPKSAGESYNVGRYQFNHGDWKDAKKADSSINGYSAEDQDKVAYWTMTQKRGASNNIVADLERGDIRAAIKHGGKEWASLPGAEAGHGQQVQKGYTVDKAVDYYNQRLTYYKSLEQGQSQGQTQSQTQSGEAKPTQSNGSGQITPPSGHGTWPVPGQYNLTQGEIGDPKYHTSRKGHHHAGVDIATPVGTNLVAFKGGTVEIASGQGSAGNMVMINHHDGTYSVYQHMNDFNKANGGKLKVGDTVKEGEQIGHSGETGNAKGVPQVHFEMRNSPELGKNINPSGFIQHVGAFGPKVQELQESLNKQGYNVGTPDGKFGKDTETGVKKWQEANGLKPTGVVDGNTLEAITHPEKYRGQSNTQSQSVPTQSQQTEAKPVQTTQSSSNAMSDGMLKRGEKGEDVKHLQEALNKHGAHLETDGNFGARTKAELQKYQSAHGLNPDGIAGEKTLASLAANEHLQRKGDRGVDVKNLQESLNGNGAHLDTDSKFGTKTKVELQAYQRANNLDPDGIAGPKTYTSLAMKDGMLTQGEKGDDVKRLQEALNKNGAQLDADGNFGPRTKIELEKYQAGHQLTADGIAGAITLAALGLSAQQQTVAETPQTVVKTAQQTTAAEATQTQTTTAPVTQTTAPAAPVTQATTTPEATQTQTVTPTTATPTAAVSTQTQQTTATETAQTMTAQSTQTASTQTTASASTPSQSAATAQITITDEAIAQASLAKMQAQLQSYGLQSQSQQHTSADMYANEHTHIGAPQQQSTSIQQQLQSAGFLNTSKDGEYGLQSAQALQSPPPPPQGEHMHMGAQQGQQHPHMGPPPLQGEHMHLGAQQNQATTPQQQLQSAGFSNSSADGQYGQQTTQTLQSPPPQGGNAFEDSRNPFNAMYLKTLEQLNKQNDAKPLELKNGASIEDLAAKLIKDGVDNNRGLNPAKSDQVTITLGKDNSVFLVQGVGDSAATVKANLADVQKDSAVHNAEAVSQKGQLLIAENPQQTKNQSYSMA